MGVRDLSRKYAQESDWVPPEKRGVGDRAQKKPPAGEIELGERRQANYLISEGLQDALKKRAQKTGVPMGVMVEEALMEYLQATCESCGR